ncbi:MAG: hypothetical protein WCD37_16290 [Chloroflexia bacterium]
MINTLNRVTGNPRVRLGVYILMGVMAVAMVALSFLQIWVMSSVQNVDAYGSVRADARGWPAGDQRGAFLILNEPHNPAFKSNLVQLLSVTSPGVITEDQAPHLGPGEIQSVLIQSAALGDPTEYHIYRIGDPTTGELKYDRQPGGKVMLVTPHLVKWKPGAYQVDIPADGMYGGRIYFQFYVDEE